MSQIFTPGTLVPIGSGVKLGEGLYERHGQTYASRVGLLRIATSSTEPATQVASIESHTLGARHALLPQIGQTVVGTITRIASRYVSIDIQVLEDERPGGRAAYLEEPFKGTIRSQDIWPADDKDAPTQLYLAFRPGDLVRGRIIGVGDASAGFLVSTGVEATLGVVFAKCAASGEPMVAVSWNEMMCSKTGTKEPRKPAKPSAPAPLTL